MSKPYFLPDKYSMSVKIDKLEKQLAKANERVKALEAERDKYFEALCMHAQRIPESDWSHNKDAVSLLNKFAIENQIKGAKALIYAFPLNASDQMKEWVEQLRKEQD